MHTNDWTRWATITGKYWSTIGRKQCWHVVHLVSFIMNCSQCVVNRNEAIDRSNASKTFVNNKHLSTIMITNEHDDVTVHDNVIDCASQLDTKHCRRCVQYCFVRDIFRFIENVTYCSSSYSKWSCVPCRWHEQLSWTIFIISLVKCSFVVVDRAVSVERR
jgi:hypothetical protein